MTIPFEDICVYILCSFICSMSSGPLKGRVNAGWGVQENQKAFFPNP